MIRDWVVYETPQKSVEAVEDLYLHSQYEDLCAEHNVIIGFMAFKTKVDAVQYAKEMYR